MQSSAVGLKSDKDTSIKEALKLYFIRPPKSPAYFGDIWSNIGPKPPRWPIHLGENRPNIILKPPSQTQQFISIAKIFHAFMEWSKMILQILVIKLWCMELVALNLLNYDNQNCCIMTYRIVIHRISWQKVVFELPIASLQSKDDSSFKTFCSEANSHPCSVCTVNPYEEQFESVRGAVCTVNPYVEQGTVRIWPARLRGAFEWLQCLEQVM